MVKKGSKGITLVALVITIIVLLLLAGIAIASLGGENGIFAKVKQAKKAQIESEMKEQLIMGLQKLQIEKQGNATLDDVTQNWADETILSDYSPILQEDSSLNGKLIVMTKDGIIGKFLIDSNLNIETMEYNTNSLEFEYTTISRTDNKVKINIVVTDKINGVKQIEYPEGNPLKVVNGTKDQISIDYEVELGQEYKFVITTGDGNKTEKIIKVDDYYYNVTKDFGEGVNIDNKTTKAAYNKTYEAIISTKENYEITDLVVTMGKEAITTSGNDVVDINTGKIKIEKVTDDINIKVTTISINISTTNQLIAFRDKVNSGKNFEGKIITLEDNIDLSNVCGAGIGNWIPIGNENTPFKGTFDGNGKKISNLYVSYGGEKKALFGYNEGMIKNLTVNGSIANTTHVGGISVYNYGTIENCTNTCNMNNTNNYKRMAGICTYNYGTIKNCKNIGNIIASKTAAIEAFGGIVASNNGIVENCMNTGNIEGYNATSGIVGWNSGKISRCFNKGNISGYGAIGGIAGHNYNGGQIYNSYNTGIISGTYSNWNAGIAGYNGYGGKAYIYNCYSINTTSIVRAVANSSIAINCYISGMTAENLNAGIDDYQQTVSTESPWINDITPNINSGYPILKWQQ